MDMIVDEHMFDRKTISTAFEHSLVRREPGDKILSRRTHRGDYPRYRVIRQKSPTSGKSGGTQRGVGRLTRFWCPLSPLNVGRA